MPLCGVYVYQSDNVDSCLFNQSPGCQHGVSHHWKLSLAPVGEGGKANEKPISQLVTGGRDGGGASLSLIQPSARSWCLPQHPNWELRTLGQNCT